VLEEKVEEELVAPDVEQHLAADECETRAQFQQELGDMLHQRRFE
jgi:hypothetical protein